MKVHRLGKRVKRGAIAACALLFVVLLAATGAQADSFTWLGPTSLITTGGNKALSSVSCTSTGQAGTSQCTTVDSSGQEITFDSATGTIISRQTVDLGLTVSAVSCPSSTQCFAVDNGGNELAFNPQSGATIEAGLNHIDTSGLTALSCTSGTACVAVDTAGDEVLFNPNNDPENTAARAGIDLSALSAVSCISGAGGKCTAVDVAGNEITFTPGASPAAASASIDGTNALSAVACPDAGTCTAVDGQGNEVSFDPTSGTLIGAVTQIDTTSGTGVALAGVSCPTTGQCVAVDSLGNEVTYAPAVTPGAQTHGIDQAGISNVPLTAVSCPASSTACAAVDNRSQEVGFTPSGTFTPAQPVASPSMSGIACPSRTQCTAIESGSSEVTFDPTTGASNSAGVQAIDTTNNALTGVACVSTTECTAVDGGGNAITFDPNTGQQKGGGFLSLEAVPATSVACLLVSGSSQCTAVDTSGNQVTFSPDPPNPSIAANTPLAEDSTALQSVACPSGSQCTAVDAAGSEVTFNPSLRDSSTPGSIDPVGSDSLLSVACPSTTRCTAVGRGQNNVISFTADPAHQPSNVTRQDLEAGSTSISVTAIACPTTTQCTAVDSLGEEATFNPASTSIDSSLLTPIAGANTLTAVACQSTSICAAVDGAGDGFEGVVPPADTTAPTVSGTASEHQPLTETNGAWTNSPTGFAHQWEDCTSTDAGTCSPISGATGATYTPTAADIDKFIRVQEIASNAGGPGTAKLSPATAQVTPAPPTNTAPPTISGTAQQAKTLSAQQGTWAEDGSSPQAPLSFAHQWERCDGAGANCAPIAGATAPTYTPTTGDIGHALIVIETAANSGGSGAPAASAPTAAVISAPPPPVEASTQAAKPVLVNSATLHAALATQGVAVSWQFVYGTTTHYNAGTPVQTIAAGHTSSVSVSQVLRNLKPGTKYHYRVDETAPATQFAPATAVFGHDMTFTTPSTGKITLVHTRLKVSPKGSVAVPIFCQSPLACVGRFSISTSAIIGHGANRRSARVLCDTSFIRVPAEHKQNIKITVAKGCQSLLASAGSHRIKGTFTTRPRSGQHGLVEPIVLATAPAKKRTPKGLR